MVVEFWLFVIAVCIVAFVAYYIGYRACNDKWKNGLAEQVSEMAGEKLEEIRQLYDETYRNVIRNLIVVVKEEIEKKNGNQE